MTIEEAYRSFAGALRKAQAETATNEKHILELRAVLNQLIEILIGNELLKPGHRRVFEKTSYYAARGQPPKVKLRVVGNKYDFPNSEVDCESRYHLCHARCCSFTFSLSKQDVEEGKVLWEIEDPYVIRHEEDGYCSHLDRDTFFCSIHEHRPATCRGYDCRGDTRVWLDFDNRIPAPMPEGLFQLTRRPPEVQAVAQAATTSECPTEKTPEPAPEK
jgi:Fe-S-cluster containining protein